MKIGAFIIVIQLAIFNAVFSQDDASISTLLKQLEQTREDTTKANLYARLCYKYCTINIDSALLYGNQSLALAAKINYAWGTANANNNVGWAYCCKGNTELGKKYITASLQQFKKLGDLKHVAIPLANLGNIYINEINYPQALISYTKAYKSFAASGENSRAAEMLYSIGRLYNLEKNAVKARSYFQQAYDMHAKEGDELYMAQALSSIANSYQYEEKYDTALTYYKRAIPVFLKNKDIYRAGNTYENIAIAYQNKKQFKEAINNMLLAEKYYRQASVGGDLAYAYSGIADMYFEDSQTGKAIENYQEALKFADENSDANLRQEILGGLSKVYFKTQDYKNAYLFLDSSNKIKDSLFTKDKQDQLLKLQTEFETERKEKENQLLKTQNLAASLKLAHNKEWLIIAFAALFVAAIFLYALYKNRQSKIKNITNLQALNTKLEEQKEEISRINTILELKALRAQMNPHFIFNCMSSIQECMLMGRIEDANSYLTKLSRLLRMVLNYSDEESISLDKELQMLNLYLQLEKIRLKNNFEYSIELDEEIVAEELLVPALILQPFAENAIWHGLVNKKDNRQLIIKGHLKNDVLHFIISDNGIGREKAEALKKDISKHQSKGVALIEKRLAVINKKMNGTNAGFSVIDLYNEDGDAAGTSVEIRLPSILI